MLVLCRRTSESLIIGEEVTVTVLSVKGNQVRFGIAAPREVAVDREEVWERKQEHDTLTLPAGEPGEHAGPGPQDTAPAPAPVRAKRPTVRANRTNKPK